MKRFSAVLLALCLAASLCACSKPAADEGKYPFKDVTMIIPYGAGGTTDVVGRQFAAALGKALDVNIIIENKGGASGSVGCRAALDAEPDGSVILFCADSLGTQRVMGISDMSYDDFSPVLAVANDPKVIVVAKDSKYDTIDDLLSDIRANSDKIQMSHTGLGGSGHVQAIIMNKFGYFPALTPYDDGNKCLLAVMSHDVVFTNSNYSTVASYIESGDLKMLAVCANDRLEGFEDVPALSEVMKGSSYYMDIPYVPLSLVVSKDVPEDTQILLRYAALIASEDPDFNRFMEENHIDKLYEKYTTIDEIKSFYKEWESLVSWLVYDEGAAKYSPSDFGIERLNY